MFQYLSENSMGHNYDRPASNMNSSPNQLIVIEFFGGLNVSIRDHINALNFVEPLKWFNLAFEVRLKSCMRPQESLSFEQLHNIQWAIQGIIAGFSFGALARDIGFLRSPIYGSVNG
jgi:hypothetical protein